MKKLCKKILVTILFMALVCTGINLSPSQAKAADYDTICNETGTATANTTYTKNFTLKYDKINAIGFHVPVRVDIQYELTNLTTNMILTSRTISASDDSAWVPASNGWYLYAFANEAPTPGEYSISYSFAQDTEYIFTIIQEKPEFYINYSSIIVTKGFTQKLKAVKATGTVKWTSSNKKVATVKNGVVKGVSTGSAVITAVDGTGTSSTCIVTVAKNELKTTKKGLNDYYAGDAYINFYHVYYKGGNLVAKANIINKSSYKIKSLKNIKLTVKTAGGKVVCKTTIKSKNFTLSPYKTKGLTITIKKKNLKTKSIQDLRGGSGKLSAKYIRNAF